MRARYIIGCLLLLALTALAQTNSTSVAAVVKAGSGTDLLLMLIPIAVPLLVAVAKWVLPFLPAWTLPIIAPALGALLDQVTTLASGQQSHVVAAAILGSAGVGLREIIDQVRQKVTPA